eukprot:350782-Chlamydomonas_euryale.AAC.3
MEDVKPPSPRLQPILHSSFPHSRTACSILRRPAPPARAWPPQTLATERAAMEDAVRDVKTGDNVLPKLMATPAAGHEALFAAEMQKYDAVRADADKNLEQQVCARVRRGAVIHCGGRGLRVRADVDKNLEQRMCAGWQGGRAPSFLHASVAEGGGQSGVARGVLVWCGVSGCAARVVWRFGLRSSLVSFDPVDAHGACG